VPQGQLVTVGRADAERVECPFSDKKAEKQQIEQKGKSMNACTQDARTATCTGSPNGSPAPSAAPYAQWNNDWKREAESGSDPPRCLAFVLLLAAACVSEQRRKRERRQIE